MNSLHHCRICRADLAAPDYRTRAPALTSVLQVIDVATEVHVCPLCGHAQSPDLPDMSGFYANQYRISLESDDHDQLVTLRDGRDVFRTDLQAEFLLSRVALAKGARVLDFGCGKAATLRKFFARRPDIIPHVFDVSDSYRTSWEGWIADGASATHELPAGWKGMFDLVTAHFVLEHVSDPVGTLRLLRSLLAPGGILFASVPDALANTGDLIVVDHVSHFTGGSFLTALGKSGLETSIVEKDLFPGAIFSTSVAGVETHAVASDAAKLHEALAQWTRIRDLLKSSASVVKGRNAAIYGAGFYGSLVKLLLTGQEGLVCFLDANPHLQGTLQGGLPVHAPGLCPPEVEVIYAGLNPMKARAILSGKPFLQGREIIWLD
jgi:trans-aconitate methyltransferase